MTEERLVRSIAVAFDELADARTPDYLEAAIERASSRRQRPAWTYPGRWLPMELTTSAASAARVPWRQFALLALLAALLLAVATAIYIGSRTRLPEPYGPAGNGLVAYAKATDIVVAEPATGKERIVVGGPDIDVSPRFSRDGSKIVFERLATGTTQGSHVAVVATDGGGLTMLTSEPLVLARSGTTAAYTFSPDGRTVAITAARPDGTPGVLLASSDGSVAPRWLELSSAAGPIISIREPAFRPTDGNQLLLTGDRAEGLGGPLVFTADVTTGAVSRVVDSPPDWGLDSARWSPDGQSISYARWDNTEPSMTVRTHIVAPDGTADRLLPAPDGMVFDIGAAWSNDGTRMLVVRGFSNGWTDTRPAIVPTDGSGVGVEIPYEGPIQSGCCYSWEWSPDDSLILGKRIVNEAPGQQVVVDVASATIADAAWKATDDPAWQRVAR